MAYFLGKSRYVVLDPACSRLDHRMSPTSSTKTVTQQGLEHQEVAKDFSDEKISLGMWTRSYLIPKPCKEVHKLELPRPEEGSTQYGKQSPRRLGASLPSSGSSGTVPIKEFLQPSAPR